MRIETLNDLYVEQLKDLHDAETQFGEALPRLAKRAHASGLRSRLESGADATRRQRKKIEGLFDGRDARPSGERCHGMRGILEEIEALADMCETPEARDAALIAGLQRVKHYEIAGYGCARAFAERLDEAEAVKRLTEIVDEEAEEDAELTRLATESINQMAAEAAAV